MKNTSLTSFDFRRQTTCSTIELIANYFPMLQQQRKTIDPASITLPVAFRPVIILAKPTSIWPYPIVCFPVYFLFFEITILRTVVCFLQTNFGCEVNKSILISVENESFFNFNLFSWSCIPYFYFLHLVLLRQLNQFQARSSCVRVIMQLFCTWPCVWFTRQ